MFRVSMLAVLALALCAGTVFADTYHEGYVSPGGYTHRGGLWHKDGYTYTRTLVQEPGYWSFDCYGRRTVYTYGSSYYQYSLYTAPVYQAPAYQPPAVNNYDAAEAALIKIAADREKHKQFLEKIKALGLDVNSLPPGVMPPAPYGYQQQYGYQGHYYNYNIPINANTQYGYSFNQYAKLYGGTDVDIAALYQMANQHTINSQKLSSDATSGFQELVARAGADKARVAEILAKGLVISQLLKSMEGAPVAEFKGYKFLVSPGGKIEKIEDGVAPEQRQAVQAKLADVIGRRCAECHAGKTIKGGINLENYLSFDQKTKERVWRAISQTDPQTAMPRNKDGTVAAPIPEEEKRYFFAN